MYFKTDPLLYHFATYIQNQNYDFVIEKVLEFDDWSSYMPIVTAKQFSQESGNSYWRIPEGPLRNLTNLNFTKQYDIPPQEIES